MPMPVADIEAEIAVIKAHLLSAESLTSSAGSDGTSLGFTQRAGLEKRLNHLYAMLDRATGKSPMFARTRVGGLRDGRA